VPPNYADFIDRLLKGKIKAVRLNDALSTWEDPDMIAVGGIYETFSAVDPGLSQTAGGLGYGAWARIAEGRVLMGVTGAAAAGVELGQASVVPQGSVAAPVFTGAALASHTHTYAQVPNHVHVETLQGGTAASTTGTHIMASAATGGALRNAATSTANPTGGVATATTAGPSATLTPAGTVSAPSFTGASHTLIQPSLTVYMWTRTA
jgi:hypothetical protein